jgi:hypothetical protein
MCHQAFTTPAARETSHHLPRARTTSLGWRVEGRPFPPLEASPLKDHHSIRAPASETATQLTSRTCETEPRHGRVPSAPRMRRLLLVADTEAGRALGMTAYGDGRARSSRGDVLAGRGPRCEIEQPATRVAGFLLRRWCPVAAGVGSRSSGGLVLPSAGRCCLESRWS